MEERRETVGAKERFLRGVAAPLRRGGRFERLLKVTKMHGVDPAIQHRLVIPHATYSPWWTDGRFMEVFQQVRDATLVDIYRLYELWRFVDQVRELDGDFIEVGVWRGGSGCLVASRAREVAPGATTFLCDTFEGVVKAGSHDNEFVGGELSNTSSGRVSDLAARLGLTHIEVLQGVFPDDADDQLSNRTFRFAHIDVDVYESARDAFLWVWDRLVPGGIVVFDDYGFHDCEGVTKFVNELAIRSDLVFFHNLNGHGVVVKR